MFGGEILNVYINIDLFRYECVCAGKKNVQHKIFLCVGRCVKNLTKRKKVLLILPAGEFL